MRKLRSPTERGTRVSRTGGGKRKWVLARRHACTQAVLTVIRTSFSMVLVWWACYRMLSALLTGPANGAAAFARSALP